MDLSRERDRERLQKAIKHLSSLLFQDCVQPSAIKIAVAMKKDSVPLGKISEYTGIPLQILEKI